MHVSVHARRVTHLLVTAIAVFVAGCTPPGSMPADSQDDAIAFANVSPMCHEGFCTGDSDPFPSEPGIWISNTVTAETCGVGGTDTDQDGLRDICENNLASYFAPQLLYKNTDNIEGEPRWAARRYWQDGVLYVVLLYLPSYYVDLGSSDPICSVAQGACDGHAGDSEAIALEVYYNESTQHWVLNKAWYSAHSGYNIYTRSGGSEYPTALSYEGRAGGRPNVYVSFHKHANYATDAECDAGGTGGLDDCIANTARLVATGAQRNLGSQSVKQIDCVYSSNPIYSGLGRQECYWQDMRFSGWIGSVPDSSPHRDRLLYFSFMTA